MIHQTSYRSRRVVGQLSRGEDLFDALQKLCVTEKIRAGHIRCSGALERAEFSRFVPGSSGYEVSQRAEHVEIASMSGTIATIGDQIVLRFDGVLFAQGPLGATLVAGQISGATALVVEFVVEALEDVTMRLGKDATTGRTTVKEITYDGRAAAAVAADAASPHAEPEPKLKPEPGVSSGAAAPQPVLAKAPQSPTTPSMSWGEVAAASATSSSTSSRSSTPRPRPVVQEADPSEIYANVSLPEDEDRPMIEPGDILRHFKLGRCKVREVGEDEEFAYVKLPGGRTTKLVIELLDIEYEGSEHNYNVFVAKKRR